MQKIEVVVRADCLEGVSQALPEAKIGPFRASDVRSFDPAANLEGWYRGARYPIARDRVKLELIVPDHEVEPAVEAIRDGIDAFVDGDADIVVLAVESSLRLRPSPWKRSRAGG